MRPRRVSEVDTDIMHGYIPQGCIHDNPWLVARVRQTNNTNSEQPRPAASSVGRRVYHCAAHTSTGTVHDREAKSMGVSMLDYSAPRA